MKSHARHRCISRARRRPAVIATLAWAAIAFSMLALVAPVALGATQEDAPPSAPPGAPFIAPSDSAGTRTQAAQPQPQAPASWEIRGLAHQPDDRSKQALLGLPRAILSPFRAGLHVATYPIRTAGQALERFLPLDEIMSGVRDDRYIVPVAGVDPQPGANVGFRAAHRNPLFAGNAFVYRAAYGGAHDQVFSITERSHDPWKTPYRAGWTHAITVKYENTSQHRYYGVGDESSEDSLSYYDLDRLVLLGRLSYAPLTWLRADLVASRYRNKLADGTGLDAGDHGVKLFFPSFTKGPDPEKTWAEMALFCDRRDERVRPHRGWCGEFYAGRASGAGSDTTSFVRYGLTLQAYAPLGARHTLAFRLAGEEINPGDGDSLHPTELLTLGGRGSLRGFFQDRFVDYATILGTIEYRYAFAPAGDFTLFMDAGEAMPGLTDEQSPLRSNFDEMHYSFGAGLRFAARDMFWTRGYVAFSSEEVILAVTLEPEFDREDRRLRR